MPSLTHADGNPGGHFQYAQSNRNFPACKGQSQVQQPPPFWPSKSPWSSGTPRDQGARSSLQSNQTKQAATSLLSLTDCLLQHVSYRRLVRHEPQAS
mmetsp:Transcript_16103/g.43891  ORF Transcript_16103/g.43891 Transcript_16103/m.43891 type:complete len:97 (-) Transcript_16103:2417-2707(-)